jgi:purine-binding chemotaxis protein CheW
LSARPEVDLAAARAPVEEHRDLLRRRAAALARVARDDAGQAGFPAIVFRLGDQTMALAADVVLQVMVLREMTPLPGAAPPLFAVTEWRGDVLVLLDLRDELGIQVRGITDLGRVIVVDGTDHAFGVLVDAASDIVDIQEEAVRPLPGSGSRLVRGIREDGIVVIDAAALLRAHGSAPRR